MSRTTKYDWILRVPGYWRTKEGHVLQTIDKPAPYGQCYYKFDGKEFLAKGCLQAQLIAEDMICNNWEEGNGKPHSFNMHYKGEGISTEECYSLTKQLAQEHNLGRCSCNREEDRMCLYLQYAGGSINKNDYIEELMHIYDIQSLSGKENNMNNNGFVMKRVEILCPECFKKKLLHEKDNDLYCDNCGTEFICTDKENKTIRYR